MLNATSIIFMSKANPSCLALQFVVPVRKFESLMTVLAVEAQLGEDSLEGARGHEVTC